jgi:hypothetical protein
MACRTDTSVTIGRIYQIPQPHVADSRRTLGTMTDQPEVIDTRLTLTLGASLEVNTGKDGGFNDWIRPEASYSIKWSGIPTEKQVRTATRFIQRQILDPVLEDVIAASQSRLIEARKEP